MHAEQTVLVHPGRPGAPARGDGQRAEAVDAELVRVLRVDRVSRVEVEVLPGDVQPLRAKADEMHLDALKMRLIERVVREAIDIDVGAEFVLFFLKGIFIVLFDWIYVVCYCFVFLVGAK